jgi:hypothetical protein
MRAVDRPVNWRLRGSCGALGVWCSNPKEVRGIPPKEFIWPSGRDFDAAAFCVRTLDSLLTNLAIKLQIRRGLGRVAVAGGLLRPNDVG